MRVHNWQEHREERMKRNVVVALMHHYVVRPRQHHNLSLYCKTFQALITYRIQTRIFANKI